MKQILIATHGKMASGIRYTAELIVGQLAEITTIDAYVTPEDNVEEQFKEFFEKHKEDRIIVFTDLMGGSVNQKLMEYAKQDNVTLVTGTNLPVLMQVMLADDDVSEEEIETYIEEARGELQMVQMHAKPKKEGEIEFLNIGNTGRFDGIDVSEKQLLSPTIMLTDEEVQNLRELVAIDPKTCMQQVPNDEQKLVKDVLDKLKDTKGL